MQQLPRIAHEDVEFIQNLPGAGADGAERQQQTHVGVRVLTTGQLLVAPKGFGRPLARAGVHVDLQRQRVTRSARRW